MLAEMSCMGWSYSARALVKLIVKGILSPLQPIINLVDNQPL
jgi:hypothetical protein